jgi:outer membrane receptor protein involved in Fe transport
MAQDGISLRAPGFCNINQLFEVNSAQAQRIEVLRGPASALYGSNAVHGLINVITPEVDSPMATSIGLEGGSHGYQRARFSTQIELAENQQLKLYGQGVSDKGYKDDSGFDQQKFNAIHYYSGESFDSKTVLAISNLNQETAGFVKGDDAYRDSDAKKTNPNPEAYRDGQSLRLYSRIDIRNGDRLLQITPYFRHSRMEFLQHFLPWAPVEENGVRSVGVNALYQRDVGAVTLSTGVDLDFTQGYLKEVQHEDFSPSKPIGVHYDYTVDAQVLAGFINARWQLSDATSLTAGLRFESTEYDYDNQTGNGSACAPDVANCRFSRPADRSDRFNEWSPRLSMLTRLNADNSVYINLASGYRAPQATELYRLQEGQLVTDLDAEQLNSIEVGLRGQAGKFFYDVAAFAMRKDDVIFQDTERQNISGGKTRHEGVEAKLSYAITPAWQLGVSASYARHTYDSAIQISRSNIDGNDIDSAPRLLANTRLRWAPREDFRTELEWVFQDDYYLNPENTQQYPGHSLLNLRLSWDATPQWNTQLRIINLTDRDYADRADFAFGDERYFIGEPRAVFVGINYKL